MTQMVFIHRPGAGGCAESFVYELEHYLGSLAPTLPGHPEGAACTSVERYAEWLRDWLWSQGKRKELVLVGYTLGGCIALQYGLDYPDEVKALVLMTTGMRPRERAPGALELRSKATADPESYRQWLELMRHQFLSMEPELAERLVECHRRVGPLSQYRDFVAIDQFDVRDRIHTRAAAAFDPRRRRSGQDAGIRARDPPGCCRFTVREAKRLWSFPLRRAACRSEPRHR